MPKWIDPVQLIPQEATTWSEIDVSSLVSDKAVGVILKCRNAHFGTAAMGWRKKGSTDSRTTVNHPSLYSIVCGIDNNKKLEIYAHASQNIFIHGYFEEHEAVFFDNAIEIVVGNTNSWEDINIANYVINQDIPTGAIFEVLGRPTYGLRKKGSTDERIPSNTSAAHNSAVIGTDNNGILQYYSSESSNRLYLSGYIKSGINFLTNSINISHEQISSWADLAQLPQGATGGIIEVYHPSSSVIYGIRKKGCIGGDRAYTKQSLTHQFAIIECDNNNLIEAYSANAALEFHLIGYPINEEITEDVPRITITDFTAHKISNKTGKDVSTVTFHSDVNLLEWEARADGNGVGQGLLVGDGGTVMANTDIEFDVDDEELLWGDKTYRINVYGKNESGWTEYVE